MAEVDIRFEREDRDGVVAVGTYLYDAATRLGIRFDDECQRLGESDACAVEIKEGADLLSEPTQAEIEHLSEERRKNGERLACQAKLEKSGEVVIMTKEKKEAEEQPKTEKTKEEFKKEFEEMPLEEKISSLLELEAMALSETLSFVINSPYAVANKVMDVMADFGQKIENETKKATRPDEHQKDEEADEEVKEEAKKNGAKASKKKTTKTSARKKTTTRKRKTTTAKKKAEDSASDETEE